MAAKIGIKLADGSFFPIMDEGASVPPETLELTTVRDDQRSVQINLFKKQSDDADPEYIGSLIVENIQQKAAGDPTIELKLALDDQNNLSAEALDVDSGARQDLKVSLETFDDPFFDEMDFDINSVMGDFTNESTEIEHESDTQFTASPFYSDEENVIEEKKRKVPLWLIILFILLGVAVLVIGVLLLTKSFDKTDEEPSMALTAMMPEKETAEEVNVLPQQAELPPEPEKKLPPETPSLEPPKPATAETQVENAPAAPEKAAEAPQKQEKPRQNSVRYKVRWGDTLWDLSETYYRNPWLYTDIAKHNKLKNPDIIIAGTHIEIPPK